MTQPPDGPQPPQDPHPPQDQPSSWQPPSAPADPTQPVAPSADPTQPYGGEVLDVGGASTITPPPSGSGARRGLVIGAGVLAVALVGGGVALAASKLGGGGAQPDEAVPSSAVAFVAVDLDPSSGQKVDALRFARKFPDARDSLKGDDPRQGLFEQLKKDGTVKGDWATDVEPWLGDRAGVAVLPPTADGEDPGVVVVLAVKDQAKARTGLAKVADGQASCEYTDDFAVCAQDAAVAKKAVADAAKSPLSDDKNYGDDLDALGEKGIARAWVDLGKAQSAIPSSGGMDPLGMGLGADVTGRAAMALRFDGPHLELTGNAIGTKFPKLTGSAAMDDLPADTLAAYGFSGADQLVGYVYDQVRAAAEKQGGAEDFDAQLKQFSDQYGISVPDDVKKAVGPRTAIVFGGVEDGTPKIAARFSGDRGTLDKIFAAAGQDGGVSIAKASAGSDTVVASSQAYADAVAAGKGLGSQKAFTDAVPGSKDAQAVLYVNIAGVVQQLADQMGMSADDRKNVDPLSSLGMSVRQDGDRLTYDLRLTTK
ncbi:hypothetical protein GCM10027446_33210 [Angustibacter peucedani]